MAFATVEDVESRWRLLTPDERRIATVLLEDAEKVWLADYSAADENALRVVSCNMVIRAMKSNGDAFGLDGQQADQVGWVPYLEPALMRPTTEEIMLLSSCPQAKTFWL